MLAGRGICVHSVLHSEFNHVGARQADGVLRRAAFTVTVVKGAHAQQRRHIRDFKTLALFGLGAAGADPRLAAAQRNSGLLAQKIVQRAAVEALQRRPEGEVREVVVD